MGMQGKESNILHGLIRTVYSDDCCIFYEQEVETIQHVFVNCQHILHVWNNRSMYIMYSFGNIRRISYRIIKSRLRFIGLFSIAKYDPFGCFNSRQQKSLSCVF